ncbi:MAG: ADP-ribosylglycohydrolase family protein [Spirochaetes bacterium]|nr:ADP-ribosylglycohydrolase family protein [Spirochaetota bacterium]
MSNRQNKIKGAFLGAVIGDTLGITLDGMSKAHIHSVYKNILNYTDPSEGLKGKLQNWRKPCLYSSASQLLILLSLYLAGTKRINSADFLQLVADSPDTPGNDTGIFRHPDIMLKTFILSSKAGYEADNDSMKIPDAANAVVLIALAFQDTKSFEEYVLNLLSFSGVFTKNTDSIAGSLVFNLLLRRIIKEENFPASELLSAAVIEAESLIEANGLYNAKIFEYGINPDYFVSSIENLRNILTQIEKITDTAEAEKKIIDFLNTKIKTSVTRATVNHPLAIIPYAVFLSRYYADISAEALFRTAECGGSAALLCAITGALTGAVHGSEGLPEILLEELINKKRVMAIVDAVIKGKAANDFIGDFFQSESSLTQKEIQEKSSKLKHIKVKEKKKKTRKDYEKEISTHVVESWTKADKAKWRRKIEKSRRENPDS